MVKNSKGGKNAKKGKNHKMEGAARELHLRNEDQQYGQIMKSLGDRRFEVYCFDGKNRIGRVPGKFRKRLFFVRDDIVLIQLRDYQDDKTDILHKYLPDEISLLKKMNEIPMKAGISQVDLLDEDGDDLVEFATNLDDI